MIYKDFNYYIHQNKLMIVVTTMDIEGNLDFSLEKDSLLLVNQKNNYILRFLSERAIEIIKNNDALLVEVGNGRLVAEYNILL